MKVLHVITGLAVGGAELQLRIVLNSRPDRVTRARALAALAMHDYAVGDFANATAHARQSLDLHVPQTRAVANSLGMIRTIPMPSAVKHAVPAISASASPPSAAVWTCTP